MPVISRNSLLFLVLFNWFLGLSDAPAMEKFAEWKDMIVREQTTVRDQQKMFEEFIAKQPQEVEKAHEKYMAFNRELRRLLLAHGISDKTPVECRDTLKKIEALQESVNNDITPVHDQIRDLDLFDEETRARKEEYSKLAEDKSLAGSAQIIREYIDDLTRLSETTQTIKQLVSALLYTEDFLGRLEQRRMSIEKELVGLWKIYFLQPLPKNFFASQTWEMVSLSAGVWLKLAPLFGLIPTLEQKSVFRDFVVRIVLTWFAACLGCWFILKKLDARQPEPHPIWPFFPCWLWMSLGLSILIHAKISEHVQFGSYQSYSDICIAAGAVSLACHLRSISLAPVSKRSSGYLLWLLWFIYSFGVTVQVWRIPAVTMTPVLIAFFLLSGIGLYVVSQRQSGLERKLSVFSAALWAVLAGMGVLGWGNLAMLISAFWFMIVLNFMLGSELTRQVWRITHTDTHEPTLLILLSSMLLPLIFIGLLTLMILWATVYLGGMPLVHHIVQSEIDWGILRFRITTVLTLAALFFLARSLIAFFRSAVTFLRLRWENVEEGVVKSLQTLVSYIVWSCYFVAALNFLGVGFEKLTFIAGGLSVGVGFALQDLIKNFVGGLMLLFGRSVHPGDQIQIDNISGRVTRIDIRSTVVQTNEDSTIFLPNADLILKKIVNWTHRDPKGRAEMEVTVPYGADTELIRKLLVDCAHANPKVLTDPPPYVLFTDFGANAMIFHLRFWIMNVVLSRDRIRSEIRFAVEKVFREHGIEIGEGDACGCTAAGKYHCQTAIAAPGPPVDPQTSR